MKSFLKLLFIVLVLLVCNGCVSTGVSIGYVEYPRYYYAPPPVIIMGHSHWHRYPAHYYHHR